MSNKLNEEEINLIQKRREGLDDFLKERMPILKEFMEDLGYDEPHLVLLEAQRFIPSLSDYLKNQKIEDEDKNWITSILGYFIGEVFVQKYNGSWFLNEDANSHTFGKYLVGGFLGFDNASIDSFKVAIDYVNQNSISLETFILNIENDVFYKKIK
ncbi:hypothetical protein A5M85_03805 [Cellulophaga lytica]|uniref:hypothetical protein n=1 Tax=Cellulophaga lytica TaxID=979 RepID=UPI000950362E|nr:hypothetical protein [Cellulophaga lytica]APU09436.1 hypothetical protein A5M85_03805 [Cellulophaga lytica]